MEQEGRESNPIDSSLYRFSDQVSQKWIVGMTMSSTIGFVLAYYQFNLGWCIGVLAISMMLIRREISNLIIQFSQEFTKNGHVIPCLGKKSHYESVEWLNQFIAKLWPILDINLLIAGKDLLEDSLREALPKIVRRIRVGDFHLSSNPLRLELLRVLDENDNLFSHEGLSTLSTPDETGSFINLECQFALKRAPKHSSTTTNPHFLLNLTCGVKKLLKVNLPILVELTEISGIIRLRLEIIPEPPFARHVTFSFIGTPKISISAKPLSAINVMNLPLLAPYIQSSIESVFASFIHPLAYTIDLSRFFLGSDVVMHTKSIGIVSLLIKKATNLSEAAYLISVSLSNHGKVLYRTRVLEDENPEWHEIVFLAITGEDVEEGSSIRLNLIDQKEPSSSVKEVSIPLISLCATPGAYQNSIQSEIHYSISFFQLAKTIPLDTKKEESDQEETIESPRKKVRTMYSNRSEEMESISAAYGQRMREMLDGRLPANINQKSGILSIQIHSAVIELDDSSHETMSNSPFENDHHHQEKVEISTFCRIAINNEVKFDTRIKPNTLSPYYNFCSEEFIKDWTKSFITIAIFDRKVGGDVIVGLVEVDLKKVLGKTSQSTRFWNLLDPFESKGLRVGGEGSSKGRIRISFLFKPLEISINPRIREGNVGTVKIDSLELTSLSEHLVGQLTLLTEDGTVISTIPTGTTRSEMKNREYQINYSLPESLELAVFNKSTSCLIIKFNGISTMKRKPIQVEGVIFISNIIDLVDSIHYVPLYRGIFDNRNYSRNFLESPILPTLPLTTKTTRPSSFLLHPPPPPTAATHSTNPVEEIPFGIIKISTSFQPGFSFAHTQLESIREREAQALQIHLLKEGGGRERGKEEVKSVLFGSSGGKEKEKEKGMRWFGRKSKH